VFAPGDGTVRTILNRGQPDVKIFCTRDRHFHLLRRSRRPRYADQRGDAADGRQRLGTSGTGGLSASTSAVVNDALTLTGFVNRPATRRIRFHADAPLKY
jgi:hypothetical protein